MPVDILPGFRFQNGRYRNEATGRFVARRDVLDLLDRQISTAEQRLSALTTAAHEGRIAPGIFAEQLSTELRRLHSQNAALGRGGWDRMDASAWGSVGRQLRDDYARVARLAEQIQAGEVTLPQALNRITGYVGNARRHFWQQEQRSIQPSEGNVLLCRRLLGQAEHCPDCIDFYNRGWQMDGTLPEPGSGTRCTVNCRCSLQRREVPASEAGEWIGSRR